MNNNATAIWVAAALSLHGAAATADIIGPTDDRTEIDPMERPFVTATGYEHNGDWIVFGNGWQTGHPRIVVTAQHLIAYEDVQGEMVWGANQSRNRPTSEDLGIYEVIVTGCPGDGPYRVEAILESGDLSSVAPADDWVIFLLDQPSCLQDDQLARRLNAGERQRHEYMFSAEPVIEGRLDGFFDRNSIGTDGVGGHNWSASNNALFPASGRYPDIPSGGRAMAGC